MGTGAILLGVAAALVVTGLAIESAAPPFGALATAAIAAKAIGAFLAVPGTIKLAFGYWRERDATRPEIAPVHAATSLPLACPGCRRITFNLKQVQLPDVTFLVIAWRMSLVRYTGCPACTRATIEEYLLRNLLSANVLWIAPAIRGAAALAASFAPGHSRDIRLLVQEQQRPWARGA